MMNFSGVMVPCLRTVHTWKFNLDMTLHLNISVFDIFFSARSLTCYNGFIGIVTCKEDFRMKPLIFCDFYPNFSVYPDANCVNVNIKVDSYIAFTVGMTFSVVDSNLIFSVENKHNATRLPFSFYFYHWHLVLKTLLVTVDKISRAVILSNQTSSKTLEVFDGPAILSPSITESTTTKHGAMFIASSFQCLVHIYLHNVSSLHYDQLKQILSYHYLLHNSSANISYDSRLNKSTSLIFVQAERNFFIQGSFHEVNYSGFQDIVCSFGGLHVSSMVKNIWTEIYLTCHSNDHNFVNRDIYSMSSELKIFTHCFKEYCDFNFKLSLTKTNCSTLHFDICKPTPILNQISMSNVTTITFNDLDLQFDCATIQLDFGTDETFVYKNLPNKRCFAMRSITVQRILTVNLLFSFKIKGVLTGKLFVCFPWKPFPIALV